MGFLQDIFSKKISSPKPSSAAGDINKTAAKELSNKALMLLMQGVTKATPDMLNEALVNLNKALELDPQSYNAWRLKGSILSMIDSREKSHFHDTEVLACYDHALALNDKDASIWFNKGGILEYMGRYEEASTCIEHSIALEPKDAAFLGESLIAKANILEALGRDSEVLPTYNSIPPSSQFYGEALKNKARILEQKGERDEAIKTYHDAGLAFLKKNMISRAIDCFDHGILISPNNEWALYQKGVALTMQFFSNNQISYLEEALTYFNRVLDMHPQEPNYLNAKGICLVHMGQFEMGIPFLDQALQINLKESLTWFNKGIALKMLLRYDEALDCFNNAIKYNPEDSSSWIQKCLIHKSQEKYEEALHDVDMAIKRSDRDFKAWKFRTEILRKLGRESAAVESEEMMKRYALFDSEELPKIAFYLMNKMF